MMQPLIPDSHAIEVRLLVKLDDAMLLYLIIANLHLIIYKMNSKTQRAIIKNLIITEAVGHHNTIA